MGATRVKLRDFRARLGKLAVNFGYEYAKSRREIYKKSGIFARFLVSKVFLGMPLTKVSKSASASVSNSREAKFIFMI